MLKATEYTQEVQLPFDDIDLNIVTEEALMQNDDYKFEIDGTGKLQIVNTGGASASEGGMGSGSSDTGKEKGDLVSNEGKKGGKPNEEDTNWDPIKENIDEATAKRNKDE